MSAPIDRILERLRARGDVKPCGKGWRCCCPAHNDNNPSLDVALGEAGRVLLLLPLPQLLGRPNLRPGSG